MLLIVCVLAIGAVALVAQPAAARSTKQQRSDFAPCWKKVLQDWFVDGRIDGVYPRICIEAAEGHLGEDAKQYSSFVQDARRATLAELAYERKHNGHHPPYTYTDNGPGPGPTAGTGGGSESSGPFVRAFDKVGPGSAESVPVPLLVLGGIAIALLVAAGGSYAARRFRGGGSGPPNLT